ncbi:MAG: DUF3419 family protein [Tepidisphaeraceae bacterium]
MSSEEAGPCAWVDEAARFPVGFAQVREDSLIDLAVLDRIGGADIRGMMIASGGCTAAALLASGRLACLHLVDVNPAQIALSRLKIHLLHDAKPLERMRILGHAPMDAEARASALAEKLDLLELPPDILGPMASVAKLGPDHVGRYELLFARLREEMGEIALEWPGILNLREAGTRILRTAPDSAFGAVMDHAFDRAMDLKNLVRLFGSAATQNSVQPFSRHFAARTRHAIAALETADNPYLWQMLTGRFPNGCAYPWLSAPRPLRMPQISETIGPFDAALDEFRDHFDFIHLSNILDWLSAEQAARMLVLTLQALRPGGCVVIRQLNSTLNLPALGAPFQWLDEEAGLLHSRDRSFFYRFVHVGRKP